MTDRQPISPKDDMLIAEYVLGVLPFEERLLLAAWLEASPTLAKRARFWEAQFALFAADIKPVAPPPRLYAKITKNLFGESAPRPRGGWSFWSGFSFASLAAGAAMAAFFYLQSSPTLYSPTEQYIANLAAQDGAVRLMARYDPIEGALRLNRLVGAPNAGRDFELWLIKGDAAPISLGVLSSEAVETVTIPAALRASVDGGVLAITDEPTGGSPTGGPTGAVLAVDALILM